MVNPSITYLFDHKTALAVSNKDNWPRLLVLTKPVAAPRLAGAFLLDRGYPSTREDGSICYEGGINPSHDSHSRNNGWEKVLKPTSVLLLAPCLHPIAVEPMDRHYVCFEFPSAFSLRTFSPYSAMIVHGRGYWMKPIVKSTSFPCSKHLNYQKGCRSGHIYAFFCRTISQSFLFQAAFDASLFATTSSH